MNALICIQGGDEFTDGCREMDAVWLKLASRRKTCVAPLACAAGAEYRMAAHNGAAYLRTLGIEDIWMAPEPDQAYDGAVRAIVDADIVVIPGGSPSRARERVVGTAVGAALRAHLAASGTFVGASAGAMVLAEWMLLPDDDMQVSNGLGVIADLVLPHYTQSRDRLVDLARDQVDDTVDIVGLPTGSGVLYGDGDPLAIGPDPCWRFAADADAAEIPHA